MCCMANTEGTFDGTCYATPVARPVWTMGTHHYTARHRPSGELHLPSEVCCGATATVQIASLNERARGAKVQQSWYPLPGDVRRPENHLSRLKQFWTEWDNMAEKRRHLLSKKRMTRTDWHSLDQNYRTTNAMLIDCPVPRLSRAARLVTTKPTPDTVHLPTPGQLHVESIQLACTRALCCCYAFCMKREELSIFYSLWLRCFVVMLQYAGFLGRSQLFGSQVKVGAPTWHLARAKCKVGAPTLELARAKSGFGARQLPHSSRLFAPRAPYTLHAFPLPSRHLTTLFFSCLQSNPRRARARR